jgi:isoleucyl-tRNA synthetase
MLAPILSFTCEEVWRFMPEALRDAKSVHLSDWPTAVLPIEQAADLTSAFATVLDVREAVTKALEEARGAKTIGKSQEAEVSVMAPAEIVAVLEQRGSEALAELFIVAQVRLSVADELTIEVHPATGEKCPRCWNLRELGSSAAHPDVCARCAEVLDTLS